MAQIINRGRMTTARRFTHSTHHNTIFLDDHYTRINYTIECAGRYERIEMVCWSDDQWLTWLVNQLAV